MISPVTSTILHQISVSVLGGLVSALGLLSADLRAQEAELPPEIEGIRIGYLKELSRVLLPQEKRYIDELRRLEQSYAAEKNYATALLIKKERLKAEVRIRSMGSAAAATVPKAVQSNAGVLSLTPADATLGGEAQADPTGTVLMGLGSEGASASWALPRLPTGGYEISIVYALAEGGPTTVVKEAFFELSLALPATGGSRSFEKTRIGVLKVREGSESLTLQIRGGAASDLLVKSVEVRPAKR